MEKMLKEIFGSQLEFYREKQEKLPLYLKDGRSFYDVEIYGVQFTLVKLPAEVRFNAAVLKKQYSTYVDKLPTPVAYGFSHITAFQRKSMIENQLPFIAGNGQVFLPFIGACFSKCGAAQLSAKSSRFTPATQSLFLLLLYSDDQLRINKGQAAKALGISPMSVSRAALQLKQLGILEEENVGTEARMHRVLSKAAALDAAADALLDPVQKSITISGENASGLKYTAGEYALSFRSDLGYPLFREYAADRKAAESGQWTPIDPDLVIGIEPVKVQVWKYSPDLFASNGTVDPVSLLCSLKGNPDERIHKCFDNIRKEIDAWQIGI